MMNNEATYSVQDVRFILKLYKPSLRECVTCEHADLDSNEYPCCNCKWSGLFDEENRCNFYQPNMKRIYKFIF